MKHRSNAHRTGELVRLLDQDLALRVADRAFVLDRGRVALTGSAQEVRDDPRLLQYLAP